MQKICARSLVLTAPATSWSCGLVAPSTLSGLISRFALYYIGFPVESWWKTMVLLKIRNEGMAE